MTFGCQKVVRKTGEYFPFDIAPWHGSILIRGGTPALRRLVHYAGVVCVFRACDNGAVLDIAAPLGFNDVLASNSIPVGKRKTVRVHVPCGLFRFRD